MDKIAEVFKVVKCKDCEFCENEVIENGMFKCNKPFTEMDNVICMLRLSIVHSNICMVNTMNIVASMKENEHYVKKAEKFMNKCEESLDDENEGDSWKK